MTAELFRNSSRTQPLSTSTKGKVTQASVITTVEYLSLLCIAGKIITRIRLNRLSLHLADNVLPESQCGFRAQHSTIDMIFAARQVQEKCREPNLDLYMAFVDLTKAFDTISRDGLWQILRKIGCPDLFVDIMWNSVNKILHREKSKPLPEHTSLDTLCSSFSKFFTGKITLIRSNFVTNDHSHNFPEPPHVENIMNQFTPTTTSEVRSIILKSTNASCDL